MTPQEAQAVLAQPAKEDVEKLLRADVLRNYRIDVETDSTVRADLTRSQENMSRFIEGAGGFITAVAPAIQTGLVPVDVATDLFSGFARAFKLGKQAEDALDRLGQMGRQMAQQGGLQQPPSPEMEKVKLEQQKAADEKAFKEREFANQEAAALRDHEFHMKQEDAKVQAEQVKAEDTKAAREHELQMKAVELLAQREAKREEMGNTADLEREKLGAQKETAMMARKDKLAERTGKNPDDLVEADHMKPLSEALEQLAALIAQNAQQQQAALAAQQKAIEEVKTYLAAPVVLERDKSGRPTGARRVLN